MSADALTLSPEMEDYLEAIAGLFRTHGEARVTDIAKRLSVRKASVSQALRTLTDKGLVRYQPYVSPTLTEAGRRIAERVQRRHDILKRFLTEVLLIKPDLAEANACRLEHAVDKEVLDHLARFMDFVQKCPRSSTEWIESEKRSANPAQDGERYDSCVQMTLGECNEPTPCEVTVEQKMTLADLQVGESARIVRVGKIGTMRRRIVDMGAVKGTEVTMVKVAPLGDPIEVKMKGYNLTLRKEEARAIRVESASEKGFAS